MEGFLLDAATFLIRWLHVVAAIAWIGESFYFVALDRGLKPPKQPQPGMSGESWSVHGGGFYHKQKYVPAPAQLPEELHWSKWKSYTTWLSGFVLLCSLYFAAPSVWLIDPSVAALTPTQAVLAALALLAGTWIAYDVICKLVGFRDGLLGVLVALLVLALCHISTSLFAGRAAFLLTGAALATVMSANVFFVIIPGQRRMVDALQRGETPNPLDGARGKQRSVHNTYFTLPVVFAMLSTHYATAFAHPDRGWMLALFMLAAAAIRQFFVVWHSGRRDWWLLGLGGLVLVLALAWMMPKTPPKPATSSSANAPAAQEETPPLPADIAAIHGILHERCTEACHSATPKLMPIAPKGTMFDTNEQIEAQAALIYQQTIALKIMPPGNLTQMSDAERDAIARWFEQRGTTN